VNRCRLSLSVALFFAVRGTCFAQTPASPATPKILICNKAAEAEHTGCTHQYIDGSFFRTITTDQMLVMVASRSNRKFAIANVTVVNNSETPLDVLPQRFSLHETAPKDKTFAYAPYQKILKVDAHRDGWANTLNAIGASMATQQVTTRTSSNGTVSATDSNGTYVNGTYDGASTSTTRIPDYAAQTQARETIRRRREALAAEAERMSHTTLKANSVLPGQTVSGLVYFEFDKKVKTFTLLIPIGDTVYQFPFVAPKN
jgi:hypothetical protein